jgi:hypothetical protein
MRDPFDVEVDDLGPALIRKDFKGCAPRRAGVVDQHVELIDVRCEPVGELAGAIFGGQVAGDEADGPACAEFLGGGGQFVLLAAGDENPGTGLQQAAGDHLADSAPTTGDQCGLFIKREQISHRPVHPPRQNQASSRSVVVRSPLSSRSNCAAVLGSS